MVNRLPQKDCPLCKAERLTKRHFESTHFWIADCVTCGTPMVVTKAHIIKYPCGTYQFIMSIIKDLFGEKAELRGSMNTIKDHWHDHIIV